jgi:hypothetical protein
LFVDPISQPVGFDGAGRENTAVKGEYKLLISAIRANDFDLPPTTLIRQISDPLTIR